MLNDEDLAYMRDTQDQARPTPATLRTRFETSDGMGGTTTTLSDPIPVTIRVALATRVPEKLADRHGLGVLTITLDLHPVRAGDTLTVSDVEAYEVVSDGPVGTWATAQRVFGTRTTWPADGV